MLLNNAGAITSAEKSRQKNSSTTSKKVEQTNCAQQTESELAASQSIHTPYRYLNINNRPLQFRTVFGLALAT